MLLSIALALLCAHTVRARLMHPRALTSNVAAASSATAPVYCATPVAKPLVTFPQNISGRLDLGGARMFSGYVNVTRDDYLFYWMFETRDANPNAPLLIWTNGGPGCSAMEGATTEIGPVNLFNIKVCQSVYQQRRDREREREREGE